MRARRFYHIAFFGMTAAFLVLAKPVIATAAIECSDLFRHSSNPTVSGFVAEKFLDRAIAERFLGVVDRQIGTKLRVHVITKSQAPGQTEQSQALFERLAARGLEFEFPESSTTTDELILKGSADLILSALRDGGIQTVTNVEPTRVAEKPKLFSDAAIRSGWGYGQTLFEKKFTRHSSYRVFRQGLLARSDRQYKALVKINPDPKSAEGLALYSDIANFGVELRISYDPRIPNSVFLTAPIDMLFSVLRHPAIREVEDIAMQMSGSEVAERDEGHRNGTLPLTQVRDRARHDLQEASGQIQILFDSESGVESAPHIFRAFRDREIESLVYLKSNGPTLSVPEHEVRTAKDYAKFVAHYHSYDFVYVSQLDGNTVPAFDGLTLDRRTNTPIENVSLKYCVRCSSEEPHPVIFAAAIRRIVRLQLERETNTKDLSLWFVGVNHEAGRNDRDFLAGYDQFIQSAVRSGALFGVLPKDREVLRTTRLIIDLRDHGALFDQVKGTDYQKALMQMLRDTVQGVGMTVTLLWSEHEGIEFDKYSAKIYEPQKSL